MSVGLCEPENKRLPNPHGLPKQPWGDTFSLCPTDQTSRHEPLPDPVNLRTEVAVRSYLRGHTEQAREVIRNSFVEFWVLAESTTRHRPAGDVPLPVRLDVVFGGVCYPSVPEHETEYPCLGFGQSLSGVGASFQSRADEAIALLKSRDWHPFHTATAPVN